VAGPGAGKTFCLISRIRHLVSAGIDPKRICAVTFTNRAAEEIADRLKAALGDGADVITRGTIHAFCLGLLREFPEAVGLERGFGIADEQYQDVILQRLRVPQERRSGMLSRFGRHRFQQYALAPDEARLVLAHNPRLFDKQLTSDIESPYDVKVQAFRDEYDEAKWLIADLGNEADAAILYRKHSVGRYLEGQLLRANIPCRLARGQSL